MDDFLSDLLCLPFVLLPSIVLAVIILGKIRDSEMAKAVWETRTGSVRSGGSSQMKQDQGHLARCRG